MIEIPFIGCYEKGFLILTKVILRIESELYLYDEKGESKVNKFVEDSEHVIEDENYADFRKPSQLTWMLVGS